MSIIATAELLIPNANILLMTPTFTNAKAIFDKVERSVNQLGLPLKSKDTKSLTFTLENNAKFSVVSQKNYESALGQYFSLLIVDETGSIDNILKIYNEFLAPALNPTTLLPSLALITSSNPVKAPPQINKISLVSIGINS